MLEHDRVARALVDIGHAAAHDGRESLRGEWLGGQRHPDILWAGFDRPLHASVKRGTGESAFLAPSVQVMLSE